MLARKDATARYNHKKYGRPLPKKKRCQRIDWTQADAMLAEGVLTCKEIATKMGCSEWSIQNRKYRESRTDHHRAAGAGPVFDYKAHLDKWIEEMRRKAGNGRNMEDFRAWLMTPPGQALLHQIVVLSDNSIFIYFSLSRRFFMAQPGFGLMLQRLREGRKLSLRELAQLSEVDHAYIYRLESGEKLSPSEDVISKLIRALKAGKREADMLRYLAEHADTDSTLVDMTLKDPTISYEIFASAASVFRGTGRPDYPKLIERVRKILKDESEDG